MRIRVPRHWLLTALPGALCVLISGPAALAQNLLLNPGFEEVDAEGKLTGWEVAEGCKVLPVAEAYRGEHAVEVRYGAGLRQTIQVQPGETYRIIGYTRRPPGQEPLSGRVLTRWLDADGAKVRGNSDYHHSAGQDWTRFRHVFSIPDGCVQIHLVVDGPYQTEDWFRFDDLSLIKVDPLSSIAPEAISALRGKSVRVVRVADCHSFALFRLPAYIERPMDGKLETFGTMSPNWERPNPHESCDFDFTLHRPEAVNLVLIHSIAQPLERATLFAELEGGWREVATLTNEEHTLLAAAFDAVITSRMRLRVHKRPQEEGITINEVQFFELSDAEAAPTEGLGLAPLATRPEEIADDLAALSAASSLALLASEEPPQDGQVKLKAGVTHHLLAEPVAEATGFGAFHLRLSFEGGEPGRAVEIALMSPNLRDRSIRYIHYADRVTSGRHAEGLNPGRNAEYRDLFRVVAPLVPAGESAVVNLAADIPDMIVRPGERVWLRLTPLADEALKLADSRLTVEWKSAEEALPEYLPDLERILRRAYAECTEAHVYDGGDKLDEFALVRLLRELQALDPGNEAARHIERRVFRLRTRVDLERPGPPDAPEWAVWQRKLLQDYADIVHWWIENRQISTGELDAYWADDTELSCEWCFVPLVTSDEKIWRALELVAEGIWRVIGEGGYSPRTMDAEHAGEYAGLSQPCMTLLDYGNPLYVERCMKTVKNMEWWTLVNEQGHRHFRSYLFNASRVDDSEGKDIDHACNAYAMKSGFYAAWYSANAQPRGWLTEWARGWANAAMSTDKGKPLGAIPYDIHAKTGEIAPYTEKWNQSVYYRDCVTHVKDLLLGAWDWTGDPAVVEPMKHQGASLNEPDLMWRMRSGETCRDEAAITRAEALIEQNHTQSDSPEPRSWSAYSMYGELAYLWAWWATRDTRYLVEGLQEQCRDMERMRWLITEAEPYTDRAYSPGDRLLPFMMLGGSGGEVRANYPDFAVSWEGIGHDVAVLVTERGDTGLKVLAYSFADRPLDVVMRTWSLPHGSYRVACGVDTDGDGAADEAVETNEMELARYWPVPVRLRPGVTTVITAEQIEELDVITGRPDLAISRHNVIIEGDELVLTVHNIGALDVPEGLQVRTLGTQGQALRSAPLPVIPAPLNCVPSTVTVRLPAGGADAVFVDAERELAEITEVNNIVHLIDGR